MRRPLVTSIVEPFDRSFGATASERRRPQTQRGRTAGIRDLEAGVLVDPGNVESIAAGLRAASSFLDRTPDARRAASEHDVRLQARKVAVARRCRRKRVGDPSPPHPPPTRTRTGVRPVTCASSWSPSRSCWPRWSARPLPGHLRIRSRCSPDVDPEVRLLWADERRPAPSRREGGRFGFKPGGARSSAVAREPPRAVRWPLDSLRMTAHSPYARARTSPPGRLMVRSASPSSRRLLER